MDCSGAAFITHKTFSSSSVELVQDRERWEKKGSQAIVRHATWAISTFYSEPSLRLSLIHLLNFSSLFLQNDDGPDVRAGSGDILLVHATETERKGTVWRRLHLLRVLLTGQCFNRFWCHWNSNFIFWDSFVMTNQLQTWTLIFFLLFLFGRSCFVLWSFSDNI